MTDRDLLRAAARDIRTLMRRRQVSDQAAAISSGDASAYSPPDPDLLALAMEIDDVTFGQRPEAADLVERISVVLGDSWEPH